jgi:hypothetical protein
VTRSSKTSCSLCGETWPRDPRLEVACPSCQRPVGQRCVRPSGHGCDFHTTREQAAIDAGFMSKECPTVQREQQAELAREAPLFARRAP